MDKLLICRICLVKNTKMFSVTNSRLQEIYETLTCKPLGTQDNKPRVVCYMCCAKLKNSYELKRRCLTTDDVLTQMHGKEPSPADLGDLQYRLNVTSVSHWHIDKTEYTEMGGQTNSVEIEIDSDYEMKVEVLEDDENPKELCRKSEDPTYGDAIMNTEIKIEEIDENEAIETIFDETGTKNLPNNKESDQIILKDTENTSTNNTSLDTSESQPAKKFKCDICQKYFKKEVEYNKHTRTHTGDKPKSTENQIRKNIANNPYRCGVCKKNFDGKSNLVSHLQSQHNKNKVYQCYICKKCFISKKRLSSHFPTHIGEKSYQCSMCEKYFTTNFNLKKHIRTHSGEKRFECKICKKSFTQSFNLHRHMRTHSGAKPYECDICNKCFTRKSDMKKHRQIHSGDKPYQCHICKKCLSSKKNLTRHSLTHTGEKPYQCDMCKKSFYTKTDLKSHLGIHVRDRGKPYHCEMCHTFFTTKYTLNSHIRKHYKVN